MNLDSYAHLKLSMDGRCLLLEFDHGKANEIGREQLFEIERLVADLEAASDVMALVTTSRRRTRKGTPIFVSGANVTERIGWSTEDVAQHVRWQRRVVSNLRRIPQFHVVVVDGLALGWGTEYLLACDYRIACPDAQFGLPETGLGILPGAGGTGDLWLHVGVSQALRLGMTGERVGPEEAHRIGLVDERAVDFNAGLARARELSELVARRSPTAVAAYKRALLSNLGLPAEQREENEGRAYERCLASGDAAVGRSHFETIRQGGQAPWGPRRTLR